MDIEGDFFFWPVVADNACFDGAFADVPVVCADCSRRDCLKNNGSLNLLAVCPFGVNCFSTVPGMARVGGGVFEDDSPQVGVRFDPVDDRVIFNRWTWLRLGEEPFGGPVVPWQVGDVINANPVKNLLPDSLRNKILTLLRLLGMASDFEYQLVRLVQNGNGRTLTESLLKAPPALQRAYWGCRYQIERCRVLQSAVYPELFGKAYDCVPVRPAEILSRQLEIMVNRFRRKSLDFDFKCSSCKLVAASPGILSCLVHVLLDNAVRYSQPGRRIVVLLNDSTRGVELEIRSCGPALEGDELDNLIAPGYRGRCVCNDGSGRLGLGLFLAAQVAELHLGTDLGVAPSGTVREGEQGFVVTITIPDRAAVVE